MERVERPPREPRGGHRRDDRERGGGRALHHPAAVERPLQRMRLADERPLDRHAPAGRMPLLEPQRREDREQVHARALTTSAPRGRGSARAPRDWRAPRGSSPDAPCTTSRTASSTILLLFVRGMSVTCTIFAGHVARRRVRADVLLDPLDQRVVEREALAQLHEQHDAHVAPSPPVLADHEALDHLVELLDLPVDLRGADAHAARIQRRVRAAVDDHAAVRGDLGVVAVAPDAGEALEVGRAVASRRRDRSRSRSASTGTAACRPARPRLPRTGARRPRRRRRPPCRARGTGSRRATPAASDCRSTKHDTMSVPPEIDAQRDVVLDRAGRRSRRLRARAASRSRASCAASRASCVLARHAAPIFASASMNLADVPKCGHPLLVRVVEQHRVPARTNGEPS